MAINPQIKAVIKRLLLRARLLRARELYLVVGSSGIAEPGWISTDIDTLNLLRERDWAVFFRPASIRAILAEHVWEHLTAEQGLAALRICRPYLCPGGHLRIAVPDGLHPDPAYIEAVRPGGSGRGADDHKLLYTCPSLAAAITAAGMRPRPLEYFDEQGCFHTEPWEPSAGKVRRSQRFDPRNTGGRLVYTSLIIDAVCEP